eukprot:jgi/Psemu1/28459/gm1.28459_g
MICFVHKDPLNGVVWGGLEAHHIAVLKLPTERGLLRSVSSVLGDTGSSRTGASILRQLFPPPPFTPIDLGPVSSLIVVSTKPFLNQTIHNRPLLRVPALPYTKYNKKPPKLQINPPSSGLEEKSYDNSNSGSTTKGKNSFTRVIAAVKARGATRTSKGG